jgi:hypothetical protein
MWPDFRNKTSSNTHQYLFSREISLCSMTGLDDNGRRIEVEQIAENENQNR